MYRHLMAALCISLAPLAACALDAGSPAPEEDPTAEASEALIVGGTCGDAVCAAGTYCCNPLSGQCVKKGMSCTLGGDSAAAPRGR